MANGDGKGGAGGDVQQQLSDLTAKFSALQTEHETLKAAKVDLEQRLDEADKEFLSEDYLSFKENKRKGSSGGGSGNGDPTFDIDRASNRELAAYVQKNYKGDMDKAVEGLKKDLDLSRQESRLLAAKLDVALAEAQHNGSDGKPSFAKSRKDIYEISKANPTWNAEQCYQQFLLKSESDSRVQAEEDKKKKEAADAEALKLATENGGVPPVAGAENDITDEKAAELAYEKAFGNKT